MYKMESHHIEEVPEQEQVHELEHVESGPSKELLSLQDNLRYIKNKESYSKNPAEYKEFCKQAYKDLTGFVIENGGEFTPDVNKIYKEFGSDGITPLIVRREDPEKVIALTEGHSISLSFDPKVVGDRGDKYVNCAIWPYGKNQVSGIRTAFLEGRGMAGPIVMVVGVRQNGEHNKVEVAEDAMLSVGTIEREAVRIASGTLTRDDLEFVIFRIQKEYFPEENLLDVEKDPNVKQIFRGFTF